MLKPVFPQPPKFSEWLITFFCRENLQEEIIGNLYEYHELLAERNSKFLGSIRYWWQVLLYLRPSTLKKIAPLPKYDFMFHFNLILAFRNLWKNRAHTILNLGGFSLGIVCAILLYFHVQEELSYDNFHTDKDQIYRVLRESTMNGELYEIGVTSGPFAPALQTDFPNQIQETMRIAKRERLVKYEDQVFNEENFHYADSNFFNFFSYPLAVGDPDNVIKNLNSVVISQEIAQKYFGDEDPLGKLLTINNDGENPYEVTGILAELPAKSHLKLDFIGNLTRYSNSNFMTQWWWNSLMTYAKIDNPEEAGRVQEQFPQFMDKYFGADFEHTGNRIDLKLEPLADTYFNHDVRFDMIEHGNQQNVFILAMVAVAILLIACFNYLNLAVATSYQRAREVGIRKVLGSNSYRLMLQFLGESLIVILLAVAIAVGLSSLLLPVFNDFFHLEVASHWASPQLWGVFAGIILISVLLSGLYPATLFSSFQAVETLKGKIFSFGKHLWLRKGLVVVQFSISIFMIVSTLLISQQLDFIQDKELGFNQDAIILIEPNNNEIAESYELFRDQLERSPNVLSVSGMTGQPGGFHDATTINVKEVPDPFRLRTVFCDYDYIPTFDIQLVAGRNFSRELSTDMNQAAILNEKAISDLGWTPEEAIGKIIKIPMLDTLDKRIVGVAGDFHFSSLHDEIEPLVISLSERTWMLAVKLQAGHISDGLNDIRQSWETLAPNNPFKYKFMDETVAHLYEQEQKQQRVYGVFAAISVFLACLGIFGLVSHATLERRKEFNIRKVLGARIDQILSLISRDFVIMIAIASLIAIPLSAFFVQNWLLNFAYRIELIEQWHLFLVGGLLALLIALITISFRAYKAARENPVDGLRYE